MTAAALADMFATVMEGALADVKAYTSPRGGMAWWDDARVGRMIARDQALAQIAEKMTVIAGEGASDAVFVVGMLVAREHDTIRRVVAYLRKHAAEFDDAVEHEEREVSTRYAFVKRRTALILADRIEKGEWR